MTEAISFAHGPAWSNRLVLAPMTTQQSHGDGSVSDEEIAWLAACSAGGFGAVITSAAYVSRRGRRWLGAFGISDDEQLPGLGRLAAGIRAGGARSLVQLHHGGRRFLRVLTGAPGQCPWDDPESDAIAMTTDEVAGVVRDFVAASVRAEHAGFDGVELHGGHGYLIGQFLDGRFNARTDRYGGSLDGRLRFLMELIEGIREATGPSFQLGVRLTPEGYGIALDEGREHARQVLATGYLDFVDMSLWDVYMKPRHGASGRLIDYVVDLPRGETRLGVTGTVRSAADVAWCLEQGADFVGAGKGAILHRDFASRAMADGDFVADALPVSADVLHEQGLSPAFVEYLEQDFTDVIRAVDTQPTPS
jgi:2,4-dienoyl-CoA reductase-like NADH-dependent reductase (Old Yellow Enzyme family)